MHLFVDLDEVLVNLDKGYEECVGIPMSEADRFFNYDQEKIWEKPKANPTFWRDLPKMKDADLLIDYVTQIDREKFIISAAVRNYPDCSTHKREWVDIHTPFSMEYVHIVRRSEKKLFAVSKGSPNILIDDYLKNIEEWEAHGGIGILHTSSENTINILHDKLKGK